MKKLILFFLFLIFIAVGGGFVFWRVFLIQPPAEAPAITFEITKGASAGEIAEALERAGLLTNDWLFRLYARLQGVEEKLQAGIFEIRPGLSVRDLARYLINPQWAERELKFIEGWNLRDYERYLEKAGLGELAAWHNLVGQPTVDYRFSKNAPPRDFNRDFAFLADKPAYLSLEGYLFPDTYRVPKNAGAEEIARRLLSNFDKKLDDSWRAEIKRQGKSIFEVVTMASLIEREAREVTDKKIVADILWRRLSIGMPLQVDASVNYITGGKSPAVSLAETKIDSPYNTYKYSGLPLGPIANPGLASLQAAIYPERNDYWFFLADQDGVLHYSKTLDEHNRLKARYLR